MLVILGVSQSFLKGYLQLMTAEEKLIARYVELINSYIDQISFINADELKNFVVATKSVTDYFSLQQFADLKSLYDDADLYVTPDADLELYAKNITKFKTLILEQLQDWTKRLPPADDKDKLQSYLNAHNHKTLKPNSAVLPKAKTTFNNAQINLFKKYMNLELKRHVKSLGTQVNEASVLNSIAEARGTTLDELHLKFINFTTKPEETPIYLAAIINLSLLLTYELEEATNERREQQIQSNYKNLLFQYCGYNKNQEGSLPALNKYRIIKDINVILEHVVRLFAGSNITLNQFKSYDLRVRNALLIDPDVFIHLANDLDRDTFDLYVQLKQLSLDLNGVLKTNNFTKFSTGIAMQSTKAVRDLLGKNNKLNFSKTKEYLNDIVCLFEDYIAENNLSAEVFSKHTLSELLELAKQQNASSTGSLSRVSP